MKKKENVGVMRKKVSVKHSVLGAALALAFLFPGTNVMAVESGVPVETGVAVDNATVGADQVLHLEEVQIEADKSQNGKAELTAHELERMPNTTGSITESLKRLSNVQFDDASRSSLNSGSILSPKISISGGKYYQNNFSIDGVSNNNKIDPTGLEEVGPSTTLGGEAENTFIDTDLLESITVFSSNVPAKYGNFVGGVVDAQTRKPSGEFGGKVSYMHTNDEWAHSRPADREDFEGSSSDADGNPVFSKNDINAYMDIPVSSKVGAILSYDIKNSTAPLTYMFDKKDQYKSKHTMFGKMSIDLDSKSDLDLTMSYSKYSAEKFANGVKDSDYTVSSPSAKIAMAYEQEIDFGTYTVTAAYSQTTIERESEESDTYSWTKGGGTTSTQWGTSATLAKEGGHGDSSRVEKDITLALDFESEPVQLGATSNVLSMGTSFENVAGEFDKYDSTTSYFSSILANNVIDNGQGAIISNEQYASRKSFKSSEGRSAQYNTFALYLQDELTWDRLTLRPGGRMDYDDLMENTNFAPRFSAEYDIFADQNLVLTSGANRYYGTSLLGYALRGNNPLVFSSRTIDGAGNLSDWNEYRRTQSEYSLKGLDTPYSDEMTLGLRSSFFGLDSSLEYVERMGHDQLTTKSRRSGTLTTKSITNDGETEYYGYTLKVSKALDNHSFSLGMTYSDQKTNFSSYTDENNDGSVSTINYGKVFYNGSLIDRADLPSANFNRPWVGVFTYEGNFFDDDLTFASVTRYSGEVDTISVKGTETVGGERYYKYQDSTLSESIVWDWKVGYEVFEYENTALQLDLVVDNVFDETAVIDKDGNRVAGRQFWAGATYTF
ncbi:MAG: TonB-dependent receptor plug domain-containing protein [Desulfovibrio sp.]